MLFHGRMATQMVAETTVILHKPHKARPPGKQYDVPGPPVTLRLVVARIVNEKGEVLAEWILLTNVSANEMPTTGIALWYYWRWRIETFFKLLKSHALNAEGWQQETGLAIARRLRVGAMAGRGEKMWERETLETDSAVTPLNIPQLPGRSGYSNGQFLNPAVPCIGNI